MSMPQFFNPMTSADGSYGAKCRLAEYHLSQGQYQEAKAILEPLAQNMQTGKLYTAQQQRQVATLLLSAYEGTKDWDKVVIVIQSATQGGEDTETDADVPFFDMAQKIVAACTLLGMIGKAMDAIEPLEKQIKKRLPAQSADRQRLECEIGKTYKKAGRPDKAQYIFQNIVCNAPQNTNNINLINIHNSAKQELQSLTINRNSARPDPARTARPYNPASPNSPVLYQRGAYPAPAPVAPSYSAAASPQSPGYASRPSSARPVTPNYTYAPSTFQPQPQPQLYPDRHPDHSHDSYRLSGGMTQAQASFLPSDPSGHHTQPQASSGRPSASIAGGSRSSGFANGLRSRLGRFLSPYPSSLGSGGRTPTGSATAASRGGRTGSGASRGLSGGVRGGLRRYRVMGGRR